MKGEHRAAEILRVMSAAEGAVMFYCYGGKDRTAVISALLLMLAGVPTVDVLADYQVTYSYIKTKLATANRDAGKENYLVAKGIRNKERDENLRRTEPEWILPFIEYIESFGGVAAYMRELGLTDGEISLLRKKLLA